MLDVLATRAVLFIKHHPLSILLPLPNYWPVQIEASLAAAGMLDVVASRAVLFIDASLATTGMLDVLATRAVLFIKHHPLSILLPPPNYWPV